MLTAVLLSSCGDELPEHCAKLEDADVRSGTEVRVKITNGRDDAIDIITRPYDGQPGFSLANADGDLLWDPDGSCNVYRCSQVMGGECDVGCPGCVVTEMIRLRSGENTFLSWPGLIFVDKTLPTDCTGNGPYCGDWHGTYDGRCVQGVVAPAGTYTVSSEAQIPCDTGAGGEECGGGDGETGGPDCGSGGPRLTASASFEHPSTTTVEILFE